MQLYEFTSQDQKEYIFLIANDNEQAIEEANNIAAQNGSNYIFGASDAIILEDVYLSKKTQIGVVEYLNFR